MTTLANRESTPAQAKARAQRIKGYIRVGTQSWITAIREVREGMHRHDYKALGFANVKGWMAAQLDGEMSVSDAFKKIRIFEGLSFLPEEKVMQIGSRNAGQLVRLPPKERKKAEWVSKATDPAVTTDQFREEVTTFIEKRTGQKRDTYVTFSRRVTEAALAHFELAIAEFARAEGIDLENQPEKISEVLDLMAATILLELQSRLKEEVVS